MGNVFMISRRDQDTGRNAGLDLRDTLQPRDPGGTAMAAEASGLNGPMYNGLKILESGEIVPVIRYEKPSKF